MSETGSMPTPRYIDVEAFKVSYRMAIYAGLEALKDKPIEREKAIAVMHTVFETLDAFPTATIESQRHDWTPCADGLPEEDGEFDVTVCVIENHEKKYYSTTATFDPFDDEDCWSHSEYSDGAVVAWKELSEPYNPDHNANGKVED